MNRVEREEVALRDLVGSFVLEHGGRSVEDHIASRWALPTKHGVLVVGVYDDSLGHMTIYGRFEDPKRAAETGCNPYSGKWNHHAGEVRHGVTAKRCFDEWVGSVAMMLPPTVAS